LKEDFEIDLGQGWLRKLKSKCFELIGVDFFVQNILSKIKLSLPCFEKKVQGA
jgi:hypothetical protein